MLSLPVTIRRFRFWLHVTQAYFIRYQIRLASFIIISILITLGVFSLWPKVSRTNIVSIGYIGSHTIESIPPEILSLVTQPLIRTNDLGQPIPALASHWTVSDDGKTYIVFLKDNLKWHDETTVDTGNISIAISNIEITALNNKAIEFKLPTAISSFPQALNKPVFKANTFYGIGEYRIVKINRSGKVVKKIILRPKNDALPIVEIKFYQTQEQVANALKIGEIKVAKIPNAGEFETWQNLSVQQETDYSQAITLFFNTQDANLASKDLRQALAYALNRSDFDGEVAHSPLSPSSWAYNESTKRYNYNTGKSKELLSKLQTENIELRFSISPGLEKIAESIKSDWEAIGLNVTPENVQSTPENFQVLLAVNELTPDPDQYALWHSTQAETNITKYNDPRIDKLLEDGRMTSDEERRKELYFDFQKSLTEDLPAIFLYHPYKYNVVYKNIEHLLEKLPDS
ncbi:hypothetical protein A3A54_00465 [Candidatus Curtissbacteria bacterium RIFCSPLOWO2_01_FULL_39_62]|uniref:Solute-binding protein family 5 domain-containing protein n=1 Tax=Candidatus Curtissbacteria bacterium RIFCSPHIGHO2_02_FULL_40_16b TaxID=1797714 RepID=A0A1F5GCB3_9BACT|nr:MAG: hypothetical protein A2775_02055 [Candidatus Curtissbacteria bacterium RIFCSPHIGHO2_01_FULL_39_57]OGD89513.1 MAG: hypothetical protein A3D04_00355 [Candidatus Curtissbacteria bacterium RIFCSPHIGHO2_02_FULL_40_16b]OGD90736.1 MAG: hypothetical protein A3E11_01930 [Candidatus Curtissbacteria bacterium RIFCSPHIGHO2_12_FULL_38_37]OGD99384.1 MAG: hypothetical protein A3J17_02455 [Candidatus Curtissbacteria bacterium RIFCSPLOWO2_02_FULL_40_11]OGE01507.1 MAG: hypothetical protein A3A54_00465 [C